jgi:cobalamin biosynthetic protein CobC
MKHGGTPPLSEGEALEDWLDLSTGINPHAFPLPEIRAAEWENLPSQAGLDELLFAARRYYSVPDALEIAAVPGTEAAIHQLPALIAGPVAIVEPTYGSHRSAWEADGRPVSALSDLSAASGETHLVVVNPNNPTGRLLEPDTVLAMGRTLGQGKVLVVDEAFMDCTPDKSVVPHLQPDMPIIILKSFGKFFGLAGVRLGFVVAAPELLRGLSGRFGDWCISGPALTIGAAALKDSQWQCDMRQRLNANISKLEAVIPTSLQIIGKTDLFLTCLHPRAAALHSFLAKRNIWTRCFSYEPTWLRIGLPKTDAGFADLAACLSEFDRQAERA